MKKFIFIANLFLTTNLFSQAPSAPSKYAELAINDFKFPVLNGGDAFWNLSLNTSLVPKNSGCSPLFSSGIWMGGYSAGNLHMAAATYRQGGVDFWPGPIGTNGLATSNSATYNNIWEISKSTIDSFKLGMFGANPPQNILSWPGNGNISFGESYLLAPFDDINQNGIYEPLQGEYPILRGDKSLFYIVNDGYNHGTTGGNKLSIEMHVMPYQFSCQDSSFIQTSLMHIDLYNRSTNIYNNFYFGINDDIGLGDSYDDAIGFDSLLNLSYTYNYDNKDSNTFSGIGYNTELPAFGLVTLNYPTSVFNYYANNANPINGNPFFGSLGIQYYNYLSGLRKDSSSIHYNFNSNAPVTTTVFTGDPVTLQGWHALSYPMATYDMRTVKGIGPFTFMPGTKLEFDLAYVFARDYQNPGNNVNPITILRNRVSSLQNYYNMQITPCGFPWVNLNQSSSIENASILRNTIIVYPNPFTEKIKLSGLNTTGQILISDISGQVVRQLNFVSANSEIDLRDLEKGVYFLNFVSDKETFVNKIVKSD